MQIVLSSLLQRPTEDFAASYSQNNSIDCYHLMTPSLYGEVVVMARSSRYSKNKTTLDNNIEQ